MPFIPRKRLDFFPLIRRAFERGFKKEEIAGATENCQVLETNNKNFLTVEMLNSLLKSLISLKVQIPGRGGYSREFCIGVCREGS